MAQSPQELNCNKAPTGPRGAHLELRGGGKERRFLCSCQSSSPPFPRRERPRRGRGSCRHGVTWELRTAGIWMVALVAGRLDISSGLRCPRLGKGDPGRRATFVTAIKASAFLCRGQTPQPTWFSGLICSRCELVSVHLQRPGLRAVCAYPRASAPASLGLTLLHTTARGAICTRASGPASSRTKRVTALSPAHWKVLPARFFQGHPARLRAATRLSVRTCGRATHPPTRPDACSAGCV